ncbi:hypothetical protein SSX86_026671 [Deinandra increscens subsp. villosa]|uniref:Growth-regulating factor n=1 Tax=Deinandra increscens subsp. villosa TaxID=3103831 RepID=A0AAP0GP70_9ASTR
METITKSRFPFPFTSTQWQELKHQALVYKYMISGMPIPPHLLFSIKTSLDSSTKLILHRHSPYQPIGWDYFPMGFGRKIDPEPGRCRRTDGKKWRCSKEAYPDSKYCERHMHRGRNRSRKPVEANLPTNLTPNIPSSSICNKSPKYPSHPPFVHPQFSSSGNADRFLMESSPYSHPGKDHRNQNSDYAFDNIYRIKEDYDEHPFLSESCGSGSISASVGDPWLLEPLAVNNSASYSSKQRSFFDYQNDYSYLQFQNSPTREKHDLKVERKDEAHKVMHHFFDESPDKDNDNDDHNKDKDSSSTQLSISIPSCGHDFFLTRNGKFTL